MVNGIPNPGPVQENLFEPPCGSRREFPWAIEKVVREEMAAAPAVQPSERGEPGGVPQRNGTPGDRHDARSAGD